jgi:uncharacterized protein YjdB
MKNNLHLTHFTCLTIVFLVFASIKTVQTQNINIEYFPGELQSTLLYVPTKEAVKIVLKDSVETESFYDSLPIDYYSYRIRGYLIPQQDGYYKFYLKVRSASFYLSQDSLEQHKMLAITSSDPWASWASWPSSLSQRYNPNTTYYIDSILLSHDRPYYFEIISESPCWIGNPWYYNYIGLKWVLPGGDQLQSIKYNYLRPASQKQVRMYCDIFENQAESGFDVLRTKPFANQKLQLHELSVDNIPSGLDHFSSRVRGYIIPPLDGIYSFYFACNDEGRFWLSTDTSTASAQLKSSINSTQTDWTQNISSQALLADHKYYFEILHHDSMENSMFKLGWTIPGDTVPEVIDYYSLIGYFDSIPVLSVALSEHKKYMQINQSFTLLSEVYPWNTNNKDVKWKSTDTSVATVNNYGTVNTINWGECQIIVQCAADTTIADTLFLNVNRIEWGLFKDKPTVNFDSLRNSSQPPDQVIEITELNTTDYMSTLDFYSSRIRGYLIPPISGDYSFYFACDDLGQFWLSPDSIPEHAILKSENDSAEYDSSHYISYQTLTAGRKYFFELIHHDSVYKDKIGLFWLIPGDTVPTVITVPYMTGSEENTPVSNFFFLDNSITAYPNWTFSPPYHITPWNSSNKTILWESSNNSIAIVNQNGEVSTISSGECHIFARIAKNPTLIDTLNIAVTNYPGPYFVKTDAMPTGEGHSWDDPAELTALADLLGRGDLPQHISVYVAQGIYKPTTNSNRNKSFIVKNFRLVGGFPQGNTGSDTTNQDVINYETILSGEIGAASTTMDNSYHVVTTHSTAVIDGFAIRDGRANSKSYGDENWYYFPENRGGGILALAEKTMIYNCKIQNNSAFDVAGGISLDGGQLIMQHCLVTGNLMQQTEIGGVQFALYANGHGAGMRLIGTTHIKDCVFENNQSWKTAFGAALASVNWGTVTTLENCTFNHNFSNSNADLMNWQGSTINLNNSTLIGSFVTAGWTTMNIKSSTIVGGGYLAFEDNHISFDNSIWTNPNLGFYAGTTLNIWQAKYSILGDSLFGINKEQLLSISLPDYSTWLDTLAFNGGTTPTMKLKNVPNNPAKSSGNLQYLGTTDQKGALRIDSVSIGAYQYDFPHSGIIEVKAFPEGLFNPATISLTKSRNASGEQFGGAIADKIILELHQATAPFSLIGTAFSANLLTTGYAHSMTITALPDSFYIVVKHRNSLETWSSAPVTPVNGLLQYDFTKQINSAYGNNLKPLGSYFGIFSGDVNQDGLLDGLDMSQIGNKANIFGVGYLPEDLNGDGIIDALDMILLDNNAGEFKEVKRP